MVGKAAPSLCEEGTRMIRTFRKNVVWISQVSVSLITTQSRQLQGSGSLLELQLGVGGTLSPGSSCPGKAGPANGE